MQDQWAGSDQPEAGGAGGKPGDGRQAAGGGGHGTDVWLWRPSGPGGPPGMRRDWTGVPTRGASFEVAGTATQFP